MSPRRHPAPFSLARRAAGILMHPTSLPGPHGVGDLGAGARGFVDFLARAGVTWWQMLPIGPPGPGNSPYSALSAFAGAPLLISLDALADEGLLTQTQCKAAGQLRADRVVYPAVTRFKLSCLRAAFAAFCAGGGLESPTFLRFCEREAAWLADHALYVALANAHRTRVWTDWPRDVRLRQRAALRSAERDFADGVAFERFIQYTFDRQWSELRDYAHQRGVGFIGDIPIFVAQDSSDVWAHRDLFDLDPSGAAKTVSGVPPDMFSKTGQRWGHPQYRWARHRQTGFAWWTARFARTFAQFDAVRVDHFLGFYRVWSVPAWDKTTIHGAWKLTPGRAMFATLRTRLGELPIIAEDLGVATPGATKLRDDFGFPGMRLLQAAFGNDAGDREHQPHNYPRRCVCYPGTHDNDTTVGWWQKLVEAERRRPRKRKGGTDEITPRSRVERYLGHPPREIHWSIIRLALQSPAGLAVIPVQDLLGLDNRFRMNTPATARGNWEYRVRAGQLTPAIAARIRDMLAAYERLRI